MADVIVKDLDSKAASRRARATKLRTRRVRQADGTLEKIYVLDTSSQNFDDQFLKLFQLNAAKARRETLRIQRNRGIAAE